jgi:hypothetical protein
MRLPSRCRKEPCECYQHEGGPEAGSENRHPRQRGKSIPEPWFPGIAEKQNASRTARYICEIGEGKKRLQTYEVGAILSTDLGWKSRLILASL